MPKDRLLEAEADLSRRSRCSFVLPKRVRFPLRPVFVLLCLFEREGDVQEDPAAADLCPTQTSYEKILPAIPPE